MKTISINYDEDFLNLIKSRKISLILSSISNSKVIILSEHDGQIHLQNYSLPQPTGISYYHPYLSIAIEGGIITFKYSINANNSGLFFPIRINFTGQLNTHEIVYSMNELFIANTLFSCVSKLSNEYSFTSHWKPPFISHGMPDDRIHLNGIATKSGHIKYITACGNTDEPNGWRRSPNGILMDIVNNKILAEGLQFPHSPRAVGSDVYFLESAKQELLKLSLANNRLQEICTFDSFPRGLSIIDERIVVVALSKIRQSNKLFKETSHSGLELVNINTGVKAGYLEFLDSIDEIFDVQILPIDNPIEILSPYERHSPSHIEVDGGLVYKL